MDTQDREARGAPPRSSANRDNTIPARCRVNREMRDLVLLQLEAQAKSPGVTSEHPSTTETTASHAANLDPYERLTSHPPSPKQQPTSLATPFPYPTHWLDAGNHPLPATRPWKERTAATPKRERQGNCEANKPGSRHTPPPSPRPTEVPADRAHTSGESPRRGRDDTKAGKSPASQYLALGPELDVTSVTAISSSGAT